MQFQEIDFIGFIYSLAKDLRSVITLPGGSYIAILPCLIADYRETAVLGSQLSTLRASFHSVLSNPGRYKETEVQSPAQGHKSHVSNQGSSMSWPFPLSPPHSNRSSAQVFWMCVDVSSDTYQWDPTADTKSNTSSFFLNNQGKKEMQTRLANFFFP